MPIIMGIQLVRRDRVIIRTEEHIVTRTTQSDLCLTVANSVFILIKLIFWDHNHCMSKLSNTQK